MLFISRTDIKKHHLLYSYPAALSHTGRSCRRWAYVKPIPMISCWYQCWSPAMLTYCPTSPWTSHNLPKLNCNFTTHYPLNGLIHAVAVFDSQLLTLSASFDFGESLQICETQPMLNGENIPGHGCQSGRVTHKFQRRGSAFPCRWAYCPQWKRPGQGLSVGDAYIGTYEEAMGLVKYRFGTATALVEKVKVEQTNTKASKILFDIHSVNT